jgi:hypothetical protein
MKKNFLITAIFLTVFAVFFIACEKDENELNDNTDTSEVVKDLSIEELIAETGINIYELSKLDGIKKIASNQLRTINAVTKTLSTTKEGDAESLDEILNQMLELSDLIILASNQGNFDIVFQLYEQLYELLLPFDIHSVGLINYELQEFICDVNNQSYQLPIEQLEVECENAIALTNEIKTLYPEFALLPEATKIDVMAAAIYVKIKDNEILIKAPEPDCRTIAKNNYAVNMAVATATFQAALIGCAFTIVGVGPCIAIAGASYAAATAVATYQYNQAIKNC